MNYLDLINKVLVRLREPKVNANNFESNPFYLTIGACVNDAKTTIEEAWDWSGLRFEDLALGTSGERTLTLPNSIDRDYQLDKVYNATSEKFLTQGNPDEGYKLSAAGLPTQQPNKYYTYINKTGLDSDPLKNSLQILFDSILPEDTGFALSGTRKQPELENWDEVLLVPAAPVYTLATALASRERGETGGTPSSELFQLAGKLLNNAIAIDSARHPEETVFYVPSNMANTNVGS